MSTPDERTLVESTLRQQQAALVNVHLKDRTARSRLMAAVQPIEDAIRQHDDP
jgi:hypothetical protein